MGFYLKLPLEVEFKFNSISNLNCNWQQNSNLNLNKQILNLIEDIANLRNGHLSFPTKPKGANLVQHIQTQRCLKNESKWHFNANSLSVLIMNFLHLMFFPTFWRTSVSYYGAEKLKEASLLQQVFKILILSAAILKYQICKDPSLKGL